MGPICKQNYYLDIAETVLRRATCLRRVYGAIIVKNDEIISTGYNGAPSGVKSCKEREECLRRKLNIPSGTKHELCYGVHAEQNAIAQAAKLGISVEGATLYCTHQPCVICCKMIINSGIKRVVYDQPYPDEFSMQLFEEAGVLVERFNGENND